MKLAVFFLVLTMTAQMSHAECLDFSGNYTSEISSISLSQESSKGSEIHISQFGCDRLVIEETDNELQVTIKTVFSASGESEKGETSDRTVGMQRIRSLFDDRFVDIQVNAHKTGQGITAVWLTEFKKDQNGNIVVSLSNNIGAHNKKDQYIWQRQ